RETAVTPVQPPPGLDADQLRFHLAAVESVSRTLAVVRDSEEMERLVLDAISETFFAWWAALYHTDGDQYTCRAVRSLRGESVAYAIPARVVRGMGLQNQVPMVPSDDAEIRDHIPAELAVVAGLDFGEGEAGLLILGRRMTGQPYEEHDLALLQSLMEISAIALRNAELLDRLRVQATVDPLTGCYNRRGHDEFLQAGITRANRYGRPFSLAVIEIDHFHRLGDDLGDEVAEYALQRVGRALRHAFRHTDRACRHEGAVFALLMEETARDEASRYAERLRVLIEALPPNAEVPRQLTISVGLAVVPEDGETPGDLWTSARRALYRAQANGRNRVEW
ncbi:MAG TPA: sensor domain-containing diguanylate cyclase, partial [Longimicrobium sp.]|nr:sensor domain-containing diguanylate cyclase [Longimicrobium sp.]